MGKYKCLAGSEEGCAEQMTALRIILTFYCRENASIDDKGAFFETSRRVFFRYSSGRA